jgi:hypothetical protein
MRETLEQDSTEDWDDQVNDDTDNHNGNRGH